MRGSLAFFSDKGVTISDTGSTPRRDGSLHLKTLDWDSARVLREITIPSVRKQFSPPGFHFEHVEFRLDLEASPDGRHAVAEPTTLLGHDRYTFEYVQIGLYLLDMQTGKIKPLLPHEKNLYGAVLGFHA